MFPDKCQGFSCKQLLKIIYERSETAHDNFGKFIHQFQPETKTLIGKHDRILKNYIDKICLYYLIKHS